MATKPCISASLTVFLFFEILISFSFAATDPPDVTALQELYKTLSYPPQLDGWKSYGGDPCEESWKGISCNGSSVIFIKLSGLNLFGNLGWKLNFLNVKHLDLSYNHIQGKIPAVIPHNATHIDLSCNNFSMNLPYSLAYMKHLHFLNVSHNDLSGPIGNIFTGLQILKRMDVEYDSRDVEYEQSMKFSNMVKLLGITTYKYVVAMITQSEPAGPSIDGGEPQSLPSSPTSLAVTAISSRSSLGLGLQYKGAWCTPPRIFVDHQNEIIPHLGRGRVPSTVDPDAVDLSDKGKRLPQRQVRISYFGRIRLLLDNFMQMINDKPVTIESLPQPHA